GHRLSLDLLAEHMHGRSRQWSPVRIGDPELQWYWLGQWSDAGIGAAQPGLAVPQWLVNLDVDIRLGGQRRGMVRGHLGHRHRRKVPRAEPLSWGDRPDEPDLRVLIKVTDQAVGVRW